MGSRRVSRRYDADLHDELLALAARPDSLAARERLWDILDDHECWPGRSLVGDDGAEAAWLVAQRAIDDVGLQRRALEYLEWAVDLDDAGEVVPWHLDDPVAVDERRRRLGLPPLAEHAADMTRQWAEHRPDATCDAD